MNKELIKKYKKEFDHWLNGGSLLTKSFSNCDITLYEEVTDSNSWSNPHRVYIINDEYVEFRKALCEGKTVQHISATTGEWVDFNKGFEPTPSYKQINKSRRNL